MMNLLQFRLPTRWRDPGTTLWSDLIRSSRWQDFVRSRHDVVVELSDLLIIEQFVPRLHRPICATISYCAEKVLERQFFVRIDQIRREVSTNSVHPVTPVAVNVTPLSTVIDLTINRRRGLRGRGFVLRWRELEGEPRDGRD